MADTTPPAKPPVNPPEGPKGNPHLDKLRALVKAWPDDHPDEKVLFGYGSHRITVGDIRGAVK